MAKKNIEVTAENGFELNDKVNALEKIKDLDAALLKDLGSLIDDPKKASKKLASKMKMLKALM